MMVLALIGGILLALAVLVREVQEGRGRARRHKELQELRAGLERHEQLMRRSVEDLYVLRTVLAERNVIDEAELVRSRARLIEQPRRAAQERDAAVRDFGISAIQIVPDDGEQKIH